MLTYNAVNTSLFNATSVLSTFYLYFAMIQL